jgi:RNA polymerase-binding protein DksA
VINWTESYEISKANSDRYVFILPIMDYFWHFLTEIEGDMATKNGKKTRYSDKELKEFESIILSKLDNAKNELNLLKDSLSRNSESGTDTTAGTLKVMEDGADTIEKENLSQLAARQQKFITNLENALVRIKNGTYGICSQTGKLIGKERLKAVPHTTLSIEAKLSQKKRSTLVSPKCLKQKYLRKTFRKHWVTSS